MASSLVRKMLTRAMTILITIALPTALFAGKNNYHSQLVNQTNQHHTEGFKLIKTKMWPTTGCLLDTGKRIVKPGESTILSIKNDANCNECGVGYSIYRISDVQNKHLFGYLSHRFADGKFSVQISRFCKVGKCVFADLNPEQNR